MAQEIKTGSPVARTDDNIIEVAIPKSIATDVIRLLNDNGYVLFAKPEKMMVVTQEDSHAKDLLRRAEECRWQIEKKVYGENPGRWMARLEELAETAREHYGYDTWITKEIKGIIDSVSVCSEGCGDE